MLVKYAIDIGKLKGGGHESKNLNGDSSHSYFDNGEVSTLAACKSLGYCYLFEALVLWTRSLF